MREIFSLYLAPDGTIGSRNGADDAAIHTVAASD